MNACILFGSFVHIAFCCWLFFEREGCHSLHVQCLRQRKVPHSGTRGCDNTKPIVFDTPLIPTRAKLIV